MFPWHFCAYHRCLIQSNLTWFEFGITNNMYPGLLAQQEQLHDTWIQSGVMLGNVLHDAWAETLPWTWVHLVVCLMTEILLGKLALQSHLMQEMQWTAWMQCRSECFGKGSSRCRGLWLKYRPKILETIWWNLCVGFPLIVSSCPPNAKKTCKVIRAAGLLP